MRAVRLAALIPLLVLAACDDSSNLRGRLLLPDGTPARGYAVQFYACNIGVENPTALTDDDGRYDVDPGSGRDCPIPGVRFFAPGSNADVAQLDLPYEHRDLTAAPDVRLWDAHLVATPGAEGDIELTWDVPAELAGATIGAFAEADGAYGPEMVWGIYADAPHATLPARGLEDRAVRAGVSASRQLEGGFSLWVHPAEVALTTGSLVSLARGASCTVGDTNVDAPPVIDDPLFGSGACPLTDGGYPIFLSYGCASPCVHPEHATIDLGEVTLVSAVAIHGLDLGLASSVVDIQVSTDGASFTTVTSVPFPDGRQDLYDVVDFEPTSARFVRLDAAMTDGYIVRLAELGVF